MTTEDYDAVIIGSGQGGNPLAQSLAKRGERVALIESGHLGGTCINTGCTPTKTLISSAQVAYYARNASKWGVNAGQVTVDMNAILKRKREVVDPMRAGWEKSVDGDGQPVLRRGRARFVGERAIECAGKVLKGQKVFIDTGGVPTIPPIEGLDSVPYLTNVSILELTEVPEHLIVMGGGYIGIEFAQMFRRFGSKVTVIHNAGQILPQEDAEIAGELQKALENESIEFKLKTKATKVSKDGSRVSVVCQGDSPQTVTGSHLLVAVGRTPQTKDLDLAKTGVEIDSKGYIKVNDRLETSAPNIWAIGDVTGGPAFTHISYNDYQIIYGNLYENAHLSTSTRIVPYAVFTDPSLGRIGITEKEARKQGKKLKVGTVPMSKVARARERGETAGLMKLVVDAETDKVLGAAILSGDGSETVQMFSVLILADKPYTLLKGAIYIHPTFAEGLFSLMDSVKAVD